MEKYELTGEIAYVAWNGYKNADGKYIENEKRGDEFYNIQYPTLLIPPEKDYDEYPMGRVVHRIRALRDIPEAGVKAGDLGGFVEEEISNLSHSGTCWIHDNAVVYNGGSVRRGAQIRENAIIDGSTVDSNAEVSGRALVTYGAHIGSDAKIYGSAAVYRGSVYNATIHGDACVISPYNGDTFEDREVKKGNWFRGQLEP